MKLRNLDGIIKNSAEDFIVEEISGDVPRVDGGKYTILQVRLKNWDTNRFVSVASSILKISRKRITFAGTKDKKGITTQYFCINGNYSNELENLSDCEIMDIFQTDRMLTLGDLRGNSFRIRLNLEQDALTNINERNDKIIEKGGYWNLYGSQRFGTTRSITHLVGEMIVKGNFESAVKTYLYNSSTDKETFRVNLSLNWDYKAGLKEYPEYLNFERAILSSLSSGGRYEDAFDGLPRSLKIMFVHAFQSMMFNRMLELRSCTVSDPSEVLAGDYVQGMDEYSNTKGELIEVTEFNVEKINELSRRGKVTAVMPLVGYETMKQTGRPGEIVDSVCKEFDVKGEMFRIEKKMDMSSSGNYRGGQIHSKRVHGSRQLGFFFAGQGDICHRSFGTASQLIKIKIIG